LERLQRDPRESVSRARRRRRRSSSAAPLAPGHGADPRNWRVIAARFRRAAPGATAHSAATLQPRNRWSPLMTMQIRATGAFAPEHRAALAHDRRAAVKDLAQALKVGDLGAASDAYAALAAKAPDRAERNPDGRFARIGAALAAGDLAGARAAFASVFTGQPPTRGGDAPPPPLPEQATTPVANGPGSLLNVSA
jgi:hypothetical protein